MARDKKPWESDQDELVKRRAEKEVKKEESPWKKILRDADKEK